MIVKNEYGYIVRIICVNAAGVQPVVGVSEGALIRYTLNGHFYQDGSSSNHNLVDFHPENFGKPEIDWDKAPGWATGYDDHRYWTGSLGRTFSKILATGERPSPSTPTIKQQVEAIAIQAIADKAIADINNFLKGVTK